MVENLIEYVKAYACLHWWPNNFLEKFPAYLLISNICVGFQPINMSLSMYLQINDFGIKSHKAIPYMLFKFLQAFESKTNELSNFTIIKDN